MLLVDLVVEPNDSNNFHEKNREVPVTMRPPTLLVNINYQLTNGFLLPGQCSSQLLKYFLFQRNSDLKPLFRSISRSRQLALND